MLFLVREKRKRNWRVEGGWGSLFPISISCILYFMHFVFAFLVFCISCILYLHFFYFVFAFPAFCICIPAFCICICKREAEEKLKGGRWMAEPVCNVSKKEVAEKGRHFLVWEAEREVDGSLAVKTSSSSLSLSLALGQGKLSIPRFDETVWCRIEFSKFAK